MSLVLAKERKLLKTTLFQNWSELKTKTTNLIQLDLLNERHVLKLNEFLQNCGIWIWVSKTPKRSHGFRPLNSLGNNFAGKKHQNPGISLCFVLFRRDSVEHYQYIGKVMLIAQGATMVNCLFINRAQSRGKKSTSGIPSATRSLIRQIIALSVVIYAFKIWHCSRNIDSVMCNCNLL